MSHLTALSCILAIAGWIITFVCLCVSHTSVHFISWWIILFELLLVIIASSALWTNSTRTYYPVVLVMIAISFSYSTNEIVKYIPQGTAPLSAAASGYIILMFAQFVWIFIFGIQHEILVPGSFGDHTISYPNAPFQKDHNTAMLYGNAGVIDIPAPTYPSSIHTNPSYPLPPVMAQDNQGSGPVGSVPIFVNSPSENTIFMTPDVDYLIPVTAIHNYHGNSDDPSELSFSKGETLYVHEKKGSWWQAKKINGLVGMIPSNYVTDKEK